MFFTVLLMSDGENDNLSRNDPIIDPVIAASETIEGWTEARQFLYSLFPKRERRKIVTPAYRRQGSPDVIPANPGSGPGLAGMTAK